MFFINNYYTGIFQRGENSRSWAYDYIDFSIFYQMPRIESFSGAHCRVNYSDPFVKNRCEKPCSQGCEGDFRNKYYSAFSLFYHLFYKLYINSCFSASCNSHKKNRFWGIGLRLFEYIFYRFLLVLSKGMIDYRIFLFKNVRYSCYRYILINCAIRIDN